MLDFAPSPDLPKFAFAKGDKVTIGGIAYRPVDATDAGYVFVRLDGQGVAESFSRSEIARLVDLGRVEHKRGALLPENARAKLELPSDLLSRLPKRTHRIARGKEAVVLVFLAKERDGKMKRTDQSIEVGRDEITGRAARILEEPSQYAGPMERTTVPSFSSRTLRRWLKAYEELGIAGLYDDVGRRGNRERRLCFEAQALLADCVRGYMAPGMTQAAIQKDVERAFERANEDRRTVGRAELVCPSKETVRQAILALDPYYCDVARLGIEAARRRHAPVGVGLDLIRPLQRVEIDTWKVDLITLLTDSGLLNYLDDEDKTRLGLTGKRKRWHLTVAMCATTRCILAMRLSRNPTAQATVQTIDMIGRDKGVWSDAFGALTPWSMRGTPELIVTDCGSEYVSYDARVVARDLGVPIEHAPAGLPQMRGRIERVFRTISVNLMARLTGRTFSNVVERGDYDSKGRAALTVDDLCAVLIRWVVDIYHRQPHRGLDGETPANCWKRLTETYGVAPPADLPRRRLAFGTRMTSTVQKDGITILGIRYHSEFLAETMLHRRKRDLNVRWYSEDIGAVAVEIDGEWIEVPSVFARHRGVRAQTWILARRTLQARFKHEAALEKHIVHQAIDDIERINGDAMKRIDMVVDGWSVERLQQEDKALFTGFSIEPDSDAVGASREKTEGGFGEDFTPIDAADHEKIREYAWNHDQSVSAPSSANARPVRTERDPSQNHGPDEPDFDIEDK